MNRNHNSAGGKLLKDLPHHIGIEHMSQEQQKNTYANSNTMAAVDTNINTSAKKMMSSIVPGSKKTKTISIYNPITEKMSMVAPNSAKKHRARARRRG